jgi:hypothetical protein
MERSVPIGICAILAHLAIMRFVLSFLPFDLSHRLGLRKQFGAESGFA